MGDESASTGSCRRGQAALPHDQLTPTCWEVSPMRSPSTRFISSVGYWLTAVQAGVEARQESESARASAASSVVRGTGSLPAGKCTGQGRAGRASRQQVESDRAGQSSLGWRRKSGWHGKAACRAAAAAAGGTHVQRLLPALPSERASSAAAPSCRCCRQQSRCHRQRRLWATPARPLRWRGLRWRAAGCSPGCPRQTRALLRYPVLFDPPAAAAPAAAWLALPRQAVPAVPRLQAGSNSQQCRVARCQGTLPAVVVASEQPQPTPKNAARCSIPRAGISQRPLG